MVDVILQSGHGWSRVDSKTLDHHSRDRRAVATVFGKSHPLVTVVKGIGLHIAYAYTLRYLSTMPHIEDLL